jgi:hypothetical protein
MKLDAKFYVQTAHLSPHDLGVLVRLIIAGPGGDNIPTHLIPMLQKVSELSRIRSAAGKKGGRPKKQKESKTKAKEKPVQVEITPSEVLKETIVWPPWAGPKVKQMWEDFKQHKAETHGKKYKSIKTEQKAINLLARYFNNGKTCYSALETAIARGWMFPVDPKEYKYSEEQQQVIFTPDEN